MFYMITTQTKVYDAATIAKYIVASERERGILLTLPKLFNLMYYLQAAYLVKMGMPCFYDAIEAGRDGPEIPSLKKIVKSTKGIVLVKDFNDVGEGVDETDKALINTIFKSGIDLSGKSIQRQIPWIAAYCNKDSNVISWNSLVEYFG